MGLKSNLLVYSDGPARPRLEAASALSLNRDASWDFAHRLFPGEHLEPLPDGTLWDFYQPGDGLVVGRVGEVWIVATRALA